jgi:uncharacterized membrane protein YkoI
MRAGPAVITVATSLGLVAAASGVGYAVGSLTPQTVQRLATTRVGPAGVSVEDRAEQERLAARASIDEAAARAAAVEAAGGGEVLEVKLDTDDGLLVWEVELRAEDGTRREVEVRADDGRVVTPKTEWNDVDDLGEAAEDAAEAAAEAAEQAFLSQRASVTETQARSAAVDALGGGEVLWLELDSDDGRVVWEVEVRTDDALQEVRLDAGDGRLLEIDRDD